MGIIKCAGRKFFFAFCIKLKKHLQHIKGSFKIVLYLFIYII